MIQIKCTVFTKGYATILEMQRKRINRRLLIQIQIAEAPSKLDSTTARKEIQ